MKADFKQLTESFYTSVCTRRLISASLVMIQASFTDRPNKSLTRWWSASENVRVVTLILNLRRLCLINRGQN